jgi:two-component system cell cycle response regulator
MRPDPERRRPAATNPDPTPPRVLVVDDDANYATFVAATATRLGMTADIAADGEAAVEQLHTTRYDIAVIDHDMPRLTGLDLIARIRSDSVTEAIYTVMLTGRNDAEMPLLALSSGFDDHMSKSASEAEIAARLTAARRIAIRQRTLDVTIGELYGLAMHDELTGVFNRRFFVSNSERMLAAGVNVTIVLFDLDEFKNVNDTWGHLAGDRVLRDVGALFLRATRPEDLVARYGGDEFVMVVANLPAGDATRVAERLASEVAALRWMAGDEQFGIAASTGLASSQLLPEATLPQLLEAADRDLYKNKWLRHHPEQRPELYVYPTAVTGESRIDLVLPLPVAQVEIVTRAAASDATPPLSVPSPAPERAAR